MAPAYDRISDLPLSVIESILMCLPVKDAARTSILSTKWRYYWSELPYLTFDDTFCQGLTGSELGSKEMLLQSICDIMLLHKVPLVKFSLSLSGLQSCPEFVRIIERLSMFSLKDLTLKMLSSPKKSLPSHIFSCQELKQLCLHNCKLKLPETFQGFSKLERLELCEIIAAGQTIRSLISSCPKLAFLTFERSEPVTHLEILAPNLQHLVIQGKFKFFSFKSTRKLAYFSFVSKVETPDNILKRWKQSNVEEFFNNLASVRNLHLDFNPLKCLAVGKVIQRPPTPLSHLEHLCLDEIWFGNVYEISCVLWLVKNSPSLKSFTLTFHYRVHGELDALEYLKAQDHSNASLNHLRAVHIRCFSGLRPELEFIHFLLDKSPSLRKFSINFSMEIDVKEHDELLKKLVEYPRSSRLVKIHHWK